MGPCVRRDDRTYMHCSLPWTASPALAMTTLRRSGSRARYDGLVRLNRLPRIRHRCREAAIHRDRLAVDIGRFVAGEEQSHRGEFVRLAGALQRIELADLAVGAALLARSKIGLVMPVSIRPGHTALIRTPVPESE